MASERRADAIGLHQRNVVGLPDVVETEQLNHQVMDPVLAGFEKREAVVARIDVEEICLERLENVVAEREAEQVAGERQYVVEPLNREHRVAHAERTRAGARTAAPGTDRFSPTFAAAKRFEPVADRIGEYDQVFHAALLGEGVSAAHDLHAGGLK